MRLSVADMMQKLNAANVKTWFDLGLFLDQLREEREKLPVEFTGSFDAFKRTLKRGGIAFITYGYSIDGVTFEVKKYAEAFEKIFDGLPIHFIAGKVGAEAQISKEYSRYQIKELSGFNSWPLYHDFFFTKLKRGSRVYNRLIGDFWQETLTITEKLGKYIEKQGIELLYGINTHSNIGNASGSLAIVLISEYLKIPVISNNHDFYWEGGHRKIDIQTKKLKPGPRDFFFKNADIGEFFSIIDLLFPWESRSWLSINLNKTQSRSVINKKGHNPGNVREIKTSIELDKYILNDEHRKIRALKEMSKIFSDRSGKITSTPAESYIRSIKNGDDLRPVLLGLKKVSHFSFLNSILFLQPTRIIERKKIEFNFELIKELTAYEDFRNYFRKNKNLRLTILITGPVAAGHLGYFKKVVRAFHKMKAKIDPYFHDKIFVAFLFSEIDKPHYTNRSKNPISIYDIYNCASLVLLPSETEGRGLPLIESAAAGIPIFTRRYTPKEAYAEVIGEYLDEKERLKVIEFQNDYLGNSVVYTITDRLIHPTRYIEEAEHNRRVVERRFSPESLRKDLYTILHTMYKQLHPDYSSATLSQQIVTRYYKRLKKSESGDTNIISTKNRKPLAGYGKLAFMMYLKSLIDPSYFRVEEQEIRGFIMEYAKKIIDRYSRQKKISFSKLHRFYNCVDQFFHIHEGSMNVRFDHAFSYRHRNKHFYPYRECTFQELTGAVNVAFERIIRPKPLRVPERKRAPYFPNLDQAMLHLSDSYKLAIDQTELLRKRLASNRPFAYFIGYDVADELEVFILRTLRHRLSVAPDEEITAEHLKKKKVVEPVYVIAPRKHAWTMFTAGAIRDSIQRGKNRDLKLLLQEGLCRIIESEQVALGVHFHELGSEALKILEDIKQKRGFIVTMGEDAAMTTDIVDIEVFHVGNARRTLTAKIMGIPEKSGFVEWVPAGLRPTVAYPTPVQTSKTFFDALQSPLLKKVTQRFGRRRTFELVREEAENNGTPLRPALEKLMKKSATEKDVVEHSYLTGIYRDGFPYYGVIAKIKLSDKTKRWKFRVVQAKDRPKTAQDLVKEFGPKEKGRARVAWNGGYLLNGELIGKLGLSQRYIGSSLGLVIADEEIICPPLFNKPALLFYKDGSIKIQRVNCKRGLVISDPTDHKKRVEFKQVGYNRKNPGDQACYYNLLYQDKEMMGDGRIICQLSGNVVKDIIKTKKGQNIRQIPTGLFLSFPHKKFPEWIQEGQPLHIEMKEFKNVMDAIEAGPLLIRAGKLDISMEREGWKTENSIMTQAARTDYEDMRGPKIAVGLDRSGNLSIVAINGRIRESVGARHRDIAKILQKRGIIHAMGFDPGGSSTLLLDGQTLNISPYHHDYEKDIYSLPPEPRPISNAVIGWQEDT